MGKKLCRILQVWMALHVATTCWAAGSAPLMLCATATSASSNYAIQYLAGPYFSHCWAGI